MRDKASRMRALLGASVLALVAVTGACSHGRSTSLEVVTTTAPTTTTTVVVTTTTLPEPRIVPVRASRGYRRPIPAQHVSGAADGATRDRVLAAIYSYSDWDADRMVRVAECESGLNPWAVNGNHHGIFQIENATLGLIEPHVELAHQIWKNHGMSRWQCKG